MCCKAQKYSRYSTDDTNISYPSKSKAVINEAVNSSLNGFRFYLNENLLLRNVFNVAGMNRDKRKTKWGPGHRWERWPRLNVSFSKKDLLVRCELWFFTQDFYTFCVRKDFNFYLKTLSRIGKKIFNILAGN